jgi:hypothetical protein
MEDLDAIEPHERSLLDAVNNGNGLALEMPEGLGGDADAVRAAGHSSRLGSPGGRRKAGGGCCRGASNACKPLSALDHE